MLNCDNVNKAWQVLTRANSHDRIHVRLNENEGMGKKGLAGENVDEAGCREQLERIGKTGIDIV